MYLLEFCKQNILIANELINDIINPRKIAKIKMDPIKIFLRLQRDCSVWF